MLTEHALDSSCGDAMALSDLSQALSLTAVAMDGLMVQRQRIASDMPAFEAGGPPARPPPHPKKN